MPSRPPTARRIFPVPPTVLPLKTVLLEPRAHDGSHVWVLGILAATEDEWELQDGAHRLRLDLAPPVADALLEPLWLNEGRRCAVQGALIAGRRREPFLVVERVVTARSFGIRVERE